MQIVRMRRAYSHDRAEDMREHHEVDEDLNHIEHEGCDVADLEYALLTEDRADQEDGSHGPEEEEVGHHVKQRDPDGLLDTYLVDNLILPFELSRLLLLISECLDSPNVREALLGQGRNRCLLVLHDLLRLFHHIPEEY